MVLLVASWAMLLHPGFAYGQGTVPQAIENASQKSEVALSSAESGSPGMSLSLTEDVTTTTLAISREYLEARIEYLKELQKIQQKEIGALEELKASKPEAKAQEEETQIGRKNLWDQLLAGGNIFVSVWNLQIMTLGGQPVTVGKIILGLAVFLIGILLIRRFTPVVRMRVLSRTRLDENAVAALEKVISYALLVIVILFSLQIVNIPLSIFAFLGGAVALAFGFGAQNILNNFISGWILMIERPIRIGDLIELEGHYGSVESIGARCTRIRLFTGIHILVPNSALLEKNVINWTLSDDRVRVHVAVGVAYGSPTRKVEELIRRAVDENKKILNDPAPIILFEDFGDNALLFEVHFWVSVRRLMDARRIKSEVRFRTDDLFREAGITIAFPQRDVHLDTLSPLEVRLSRDMRRQEEKERKKQKAEEEESKRRERDPKTGENSAKPQQAFEPQKEDEDEDEGDEGDNGGDPLGSGV